MSDCIEIRVQLLVTCARGPLFSPPRADESRCTPDYSRDNIREQITNFPAALITHFCKKPRLRAHNHGVCSSSSHQEQTLLAFCPSDRAAAVWCASKPFTFLPCGGSSRWRGRRYECKTEFTVPQTRRADNQELDLLQFRIVHRFPLVSDP